MIDWTVVMDRGDDLLLLSGNPDRLSGHIQQYTITEDVTVRNYMAIEVVVCGTDAASVLGIELDPWAFLDKDFAGVRIQVVRIEPLMGDAYAVLAPDAVALRSLLAKQGRALTPEDVDALRVEGRIPACPNEINEDHNPWEAGLQGAINLAKGCYIGQEVIARLNTYDKVRRKLVALRLDRPFEQGAPLLHGGEEVGQVTTVAGDRALGYVAVEQAAAGTALDGAFVL
jgi:folate-binding protein YgfZ